MEPIELSIEFLSFLKKEGFNVLIDKGRCGAYTAVKADIEQLINQASTTPFQETNMMIIDNLLEHAHADDLKDMLAYFPE